MLRIKKSEFVTSVGKNGGYPSEGGAEIAIVGKSNVGKSSIINSLCNMNKLAKTSQKPGKTRLINYFRINGDFYIVDLPGYGFARVSKAEKDKWGKMLDDFFAEKENIAHVFALADIRHEPTRDDLVMIDYLYYERIPFTVVATKSDKLAKTRVKDAVRRIAAAFKTGEGNVLPVSAVTKKGKDEVLSLIEKICTLETETEEEL